MIPAFRTTKAAPAWAALAILGIGHTMLTGPGCGEDLGDPVLRYADWDATLPQSDGGGTNSNANLAEWLPDCGPGYYPCPPYGTRRNQVLESFDMVAANDEAWELADEDGVFGLVDLHLSGAKLLFVFLTAGW
ncbi:MAG: hypothetical protein RBU30_06405 [Polyangia bacterium]|jgi:hypothetical protein|nr:hypothetical protein [Polyangia bacterium]